MNNNFYKSIKPIADIFFGTIGLVIFWPILLLLIALILMISGRPIFYRQNRLGLKGQLFNLIKFRTMTNIFDNHGKLLPDKQRLTKFGKFLRRTSLDELPEFINVLKGDMSLVGPRPLLEEYLPLYSKEQARRHEVKPGITGWAQVNGRNAISWKQKFEFDVWYVDNVSFFLDIKILILTIVRIFQRQGITQKGQATMEKFRGNQD